MPNSNNTVGSSTSDRGNTRAHAAPSGQIYRTKRSSKRLATHTHYPAPIAESLLRPHFAAITVLRCSPSLSTRPCLALSKAARSCATMLSAAFASSSGSLGLRGLSWPREKLLRLELAWLGARLAGLERSTPRMELARVDGPLGTSRVLPGALRNSVLRDSWERLSAERSNEFWREGAREVAAEVEVEWERW